MNRRLLNPLFPLLDPFFSEPFVVKRALPSHPRKSKKKIEQKKDEISSTQTFDNFFKDYVKNTSQLKSEQKQFFQKHYPEKLVKKFDAYQVLGLQKNADLQKIKQAYRINAIKYHPKNDDTIEAQKKFQDISKAYNLLTKQKKTDDYGEDISIKSFFEDFERQMQGFNKIQQAKVQNQNQVETNNKKLQEKNQSATDKCGQQKVEQKLGNSNQRVVGKNKIKDLLKGSELYEQSSYQQYINGKRKLHTTKMYHKDGKIIKVDKIQESKKNGTVEVTETFDDGKQIKNRKYVKGQNKQIGYLIF